MHVTMIWHGGSSYADGSPERFRTLRDAVLTFHARLHDQRHFPCVDAVPQDEGGPSAWVFFGPAGEYPDRVIECGPRGGVRVTRA